MTPAGCRKRESRAKAANFQATRAIRSHGAWSVGSTRSARHFRDSRPAEPAFLRGRPMSMTLAAGRSEAADAVQPASLCFVVDPDFVFIQGFAKSLRGVGVDTVELISSARLAENID